MKMLLLIACLSTGCVLQPYPPNAIVRVSEGTEAGLEQRVRTLLYRSIDFLMACSLVREEMPEMGIALEVLASSGINVKFDKLPEDRCGQAPVGGDTMSLQVDIENTVGCDINKAVPHELLHLLGMDHGDSFNRVMANCLWGV